MALSLAPLGSLEEGGWSVTRGGSVLVVLLKLLQSPQAWQQNYGPWGKAYYFVLICRPKPWLLSLIPLQQCRWFLTTIALMETFLFLWMIAGTCCCNCLRFRSCTASGRLIVVLMLLRVWVLLVLMWRFLLQPPSHAFLLFKIWYVGNLSPQIVYNLGWSFFLVSMLFQFTKKKKNHYNESTHKKEEAQYHFTIYIYFLTDLYYYLIITINQHK